MKKKLIFICSVILIAISTKSNASPLVSPIDPATGELKSSSIDAQQVNQNATSQQVSNNLPVINSNNKLISEQSGLLDDSINKQSEETSVHLMEEKILEKRKAKKTDDNKDDDDDDDDGDGKKKKPGESSKKDDKDDDDSKDKNDDNKDGDDDKKDSGKDGDDDDKGKDGKDDDSSDESDKKKKKKKKVNKDDKSSSEADTDEEKDSNSDESQPDDKSDDTSEENSNPNSKSDPNTEEEGDSSSESRTSEEKKDGKDTSEESIDEGSSEDEEEESESNTTENDQDESLVSSSESSNSDNDKNKLLIILLDGVNPEYITRDEKKLKAFEAIKSNGVSVRYVKPVFPSNPMPNWYSIATGRYPDKHGIVNDYMYDSKTRHMFLKDSSKEGKQTHWWNADAEPIWITARKQRKRVSVSWWAGCDVIIKRSKPQFCDPYEEGMSSDPKYTETVTNKLEDIIDKFAKDELDLAMVYYESIGRSARRTGPDSKKTKKSLREFDKILTSVIDEISEKKLEDNVNVIILSDNGIVTATREIKLEKLIDFNDIDKAVGTGAFVMLKPEKSKTDFIFNQLRQSLVKGLNVYKSNKLPPRYRIKHPSRLLPIIVTSDEGYHLSVPNIKNKVIPSESSEESNSASAEAGFTGYDPDHVEESRAILYALGPDFRIGYTGPPVKQVDHYNLFCKLLDIRPKDNDGTGKRIEKLLKGAEEDDSSDSDDDDSSSDSEEDDDDGASALTLSLSLFIISLARILLMD